MFTRFLKVFLTETKFQQPFLTGDSFLQFMSWFFILDSSADTPISYSSSPKWR